MLDFFARYGASFCEELPWICVYLLQYDMELVFVKNSHEFVHEYMKKPEYVELMRRLGALGDGNQDQSMFIPCNPLFPLYIQTVA